MKSVRKYTRSSTEDFCLYSLLKMFGISKEIDQELHRGLLLIFFIKMYEISEEIDQELHRGFLLIFLIGRVRNSSGNRPGAPQRTSAEDFCLYSLSDAYEISEERLALKSIRK